MDFEQILKLIVYLFCALIIFALIVPAISYKQKNSSYFILVVFSTAQLVLYHQVFRWDVIGTLWRDVLFVLLLLSVSIGLYRRHSRKAVTKSVCITIFTIVATTVIVTKWLLPGLISKTYPDQNIVKIASPLPDGKYF